MVPVLIISCQVSEKSKIGPSDAQVTIIKTAIQKVLALPVALAILTDVLWKMSLISLSHQIVLDLSRPYIVYA